MQIGTNSITSLLAQMQSAIGGAASSGATTLQDLLGDAANTASSVGQLASAAPISPIGMSPAAQFSSQLLSALMDAQGAGSSNSASSGSSTSSVSASALTNLENTLTGSGVASSTSSTAAQSLASLMGGGSSASSSSSDPTSSSTDSSSSTSGHHGHHHGGGGAMAALQTLGADASSVVSSTASIAAGLLAKL